MAANIVGLAGYDIIFAYFLVEAKSKKKHIITIFITCKIPIMLIEMFFQIAFY